MPGSNQGGLEALAALQDYLAALFEDLPAPLALSAASPAQEVAELALLYGKKLMQLSQQCTAHYRSEHFIPRREAESQLATLHACLFQQPAPALPFQQAMQAIMLRLQQGERPERLERPSASSKLSMPESRLALTELKSDPGHRQLPPDPPSQQHSRASKRRASSKPPALRELLAIKQCLEREEEAIRELFEQMRRWLEKTGGDGGEEGRVRLGRVEAAEEKAGELVRLHTEGHCQHVKQLASLARLLQDRLERKLEREGLAQSRLAAVLDESQRLEQLHSYSLSALLQQAAHLQSLLTDSPSLCPQQLAKIQASAEQLYGLFPSRQSLSQLAYVSLAEPGFLRNQAVQASVGPVHRKHTSEGFRAQVRVVECLERLQRGFRGKKVVEGKEVDRALQSIRELCTIRAASPEEADFSGEYRRLAAEHEQALRETQASLTKRLRQVQGKLDEAEDALGRAKERHGQEVDKVQKEKAKLGKRLEGVESEAKKVEGERRRLEKSLAECLREVEEMRSAVQLQRQEQVLRGRELEEEREALRRKVEQSEREAERAAGEFKAEKQGLSEERKVYRQKIALVEGQLAGERELTVGLRVELESALGEGSALRSQLSDMTRVYEEKIQEVEQTIASIGELQSVRDRQEEAIGSLSGQLQAQKEHCARLEGHLAVSRKRERDLEEDNQALQGEAGKFRQDAQLTASDLSTLRREVEKVSEAYLETESALEVARQSLFKAENELSSACAERVRLGRELEELRAEVAAVRTKAQAVELAERDTRDEYYQKCQEVSRAQGELQESRREAAKQRKELSEERQARTQGQQQLNEARQQLARIKDTHSAQLGRQRLEAEELRVELRRSQQEWERQRSAYEERQGILSRQMQDLEESAEQRQMLAQLLGHRSQ